jgi:hypothetical protein
MSKALTELGAQRKIADQYGVSVPIKHIGVGDFSPGRKEWPVYVNSGSASPDIYWVS